MSDLNTAEGRINAGRARIQEAVGSHSSELDFSNLKLTDRELRSLLSLLPDPGTITRLNLSGNQIKTLPKEVYQLKKLDTLNLSDNDIKYLPKEIAKLPDLTTLHLANNLIKSIPEKGITAPKLNWLSLDGNPIAYLPKNIGQLPSLKHLVFDFSQLTVLSDQIGRLPYNLRVVQTTKTGERTDHIDMPADRESEPVARLNNGASAEYIDIKAVPGKEKNLVWTDIFGLYKDDALKKIDALKLTDARPFFRRPAPMKFNDATGEGLLPTEVLERFMQGLEIQSPGSLTQIYIPALKKYLAPLLDEKTTIAEKKNILQTIATSLGNCDTPKIDLITQIYIGQKLEAKPYEKLKLFDQRMIEREAVEAWVAARVGNWTDEWMKNWDEQWEQKNPHLITDDERRNLSDAEWTNLNREWEDANWTRTMMTKERTELIKGLSNVLYTEDAWSYRKSEIDIIADREFLELPFKTQNTVGYLLVKELKEPLLQEFCQKDNHGELVPANEGWDGDRWILDLNKIDAIREDFLQSCGHGTEKSKQISDLAAAYETAIQKTMFENGFFDIHDGKPEVNKMLNNMANQRDELKTILRSAENIEETFEQFLKKDKEAITDLVATFEAQTEENKPQQLTGQDRLSLFAEPKNIQSKHEAASSVKTKLRDSQDVRPSSTHLRTRM